MNTARKLLEENLQHLDERQTREVLAFVRSLSSRNDPSPTLDRLRADPAFTVPAQFVSGSGRVKPLEQEGVLASELLVRERR